jgi:hypothetical protein
MNGQEKYPGNEPAVPLWKLERYLLRELPASELERIDKLKSADPELASWIKALETEHADLAASHPTGVMAGRIRNKLDNLSKPGAKRDGHAVRSRTEGGMNLWLRPVFLVPVSGLALLLAFTLAPLRDRRDQASADMETTRIKGSLPELYMYRKSGQVPEILPTGAPVRSGDLIQVFYDAAGKKYGAIYSVDGRGNVTWHLPELSRESAGRPGGGLRSVELKTAGKTPLPSAFELDDAPGEEKFFFVTSDRPFVLDGLPSTVPSGAASRPVFTLTKENGK